MLIYWIIILAIAKNKHCGYNHNIKQGNDGGTNMKRKITNRELEKAKRAISRIAADQGISEEAVRHEMLEAIRAGMNNPDPAVQSRWQSIQWRGIEPTPEEFIAALSMRILTHDRPKGYNS